MRVLVDTNVLVDQLTSGPRGRLAEAALARLADDGHEPLLAYQVLAELWVVATRPAAANGLGLEPQTVGLMSITIDQPGWWCPRDATHDVVLDETDSDATGPLLLAHRAVVEGGMPPAEVRRNRERLGLSQREAGRVIGGGPLAFHKYENGEVATTQAVGNFLRLLDRHPELVAELRQARDDRAA